MSISFVLDATHRNINSIPRGMLAALYTTGSADIKATATDFGLHPDAIHICQDNGSDETADILDMESGAATPQDCANWIPKARMSYNNIARKGQRWPGIYCSLSRITEVANEFVAAKITKVPLWVAEWGMAQNLAINNINAANGPFPTVAFQIKNQGVNDFSVFSTEWLTRRSGMAAPVTPPVKAETPPGQWTDAHAWNWKDAYVLGIGLDGKLHTFHFDQTTGKWVKLV